MINLNPRISDRLRKIFNLKQWAVRDELIDYNPVAVVNDRIYYSDKIIVRSATTGTIYTTDNDQTKRFYITSVWLAVNGDGTGAEATIAATIDSVAQTIASIKTSEQLSTGSNQACSLNFSVPLRVDVNTAISFTPGTGNSGRAIIYGFYEVV